MLIRAHKYRGHHLLRDQSKKKASTTGASVGKTLTALVAVGALALAACGIPQETDSAAVTVNRKPSAMQIDPGPPWQPDVPAIAPVPSVAPAIEFGGMTTPSWEPEMKKLEEILGTPDTGVIGDSEPTGHPNSGRLATYLGEGPASGPR